MILFLLFIKADFIFNTKDPAIDRKIGCVIHNTYHKIAIRATAFENQFSTDRTRFAVVTKKIRRSRAVKKKKKKKYDLQSLHVAK